jgi:hypothetical protein
MIDKDEIVSEFNGVAQDVAPAVMPPNLFQEDQGGDRYFRGSWRRRRGMIHTGLAKFDDPVTSLIGFEMAGDDFAIVVVEGTNVHGFLNTAEQDYTIPTGWGETGFGEDMGE